MSSAQIQFFRFIGFDFVREKPRFEDSLVHATLNGGNFPGQPET